MIGRAAGQLRPERQMYVLLFAGMIVAVGFVLFTGRWILRPINRLIRSAEEIKRGNLELVVQSDSRDEIGRLSEAFNEMASALRESRRSDQTKLMRIQRATEQTFNSLPDAVAIVDPGGKVEVATETAKKCFWSQTQQTDPEFAAPVDGRDFHRSAEDGSNDRAQGRTEGHPAFRGWRGTLLPSRGHSDP